MNNQSEKTVREGRETQFGTEEEDFFSSPGCVVHRQLGES